MTTKNQPCKYKSFCSCRTAFRPCMDDTLAHACLARAWISGYSITAWISLTRCSAAAKFVPDNVYASSLAGMLSFASAWTFQVSTARMPDDSGCYCPPDCPLQRHLFLAHHPTQITRRSRKILQMPFQKRTMCPPSDCLMSFHLCVWSHVEMKQGLVSLALSMVCFRPFLPRFSLMMTGRRDERKDFAVHPEGPRLLFLAFDSRINEALLEFFFAVALLKSCRSCRKASF